MAIMGILESLILFVAVLLMAIADSAGTGILNNFGTITVLTLVASVGLTILFFHRSIISPKGWFFH